MCVCDVAVGHCWCVSFPDYRAVIPRWGFVVLPTVFLSDLKHGHELAKGCSSQNFNSHTFIDLFVP